MASNLTDYAEKKLLDHVLGVASYAMPSTVYLALFTSDPTETGVAGTEVSGNGYARQSISFTATTSGTGATSNSGNVTFPAATASWGTITHIGLMDASTVGNMLWYGPLTTSKAVNTGDQFQMAATKLSISLG
jgi:hypothetical protein